MSREIKSFTELYSTYQLDYNYYDYKHQTTFSLFVDNFEMKAQQIEDKVTKVLNGFSD